MPDAQVQVPAITAGQSRQQELEAASHATPTVKSRELLLMHACSAQITLSVSFSPELRPLSDTTPNQGRPSHHN